MVDFGGWELPQQYTSIRDEHIAVRKAAGLFDISHMGRFKVTGEAGLAFLQSLLTNDLSRIGRGRAQYNLMCNDQGGILDDLVVYWGDDGFTVVVNAANRERDLEWMRSHAPSSVEIEDRTFELALIAFQGPRAQELLPAKGLDDLPYFGFRPGQVAGVSALVSRTGYTGEDGFEIFVSADLVGSRLRCASTATTWTTASIRTRRASVGPCASTKGSSSAATRWDGSSATGQREPWSG